MNVSSSVSPTCQRILRAIASVLLGLGCAGASCAQQYDRRIHMNAIEEQAEGYFRKGDIGRAREVIERALDAGKSFGGHPLVSLAALESYRRHQQWKDWERVASGVLAWEKEEENASTYAMMRTAAAKGYLVQGRFEEAAQVVASIVSDSHKNSSFYRNLEELANEYSRYGKTAEASKLVEVAAGVKRNAGLGGGASGANGQPKVANQAARQDLMVRVSPEQFAGVLQEIGFRAEILTNDKGRQRIRTRMGGWNVAVLFYNCKDNKDCTSVRFSTYWTEKKWNADFANAWNSSRRFSKLFIDKENDLGIDYDILVTDGITRANVKAHLNILEDHLRALRQQLRK